MLKKSLLNQYYDFGLENGLKESSEMFKLASDNDAADLKGQSVKIMAEYVLKCLNITFVLITC